MRTPRFSEVTLCVTLKCSLKFIYMRGIFVLGGKGRCICLTCSPRLMILSLVLHQDNAAGHNLVWAKADQKVLD